MRTKLIRNLKPGDRFRIQGIERHQTAVITVIRVQETRRAHFSGERQWMVCANWPWWWPNGMVAHSGERIEIL